MENQNERLFEFQKLHQKYELLLQRNDQFGREVLEKDLEALRKEKQFNDLQVLVDNLKKENGDLKVQIGSWSDQYNYIQESTSFMIDVTKRKNTEIIKSEKKLEQNFKKIEEENFKLNFELEKTSGEVVALQQTVSLMRSEFLILNKFKEDLESRLSQARKVSIEGRGDHRGSFVDSQFEKSLSMDFDLQSIGSRNVGLRRSSANKKRQFTLQKINSEHFIEKKKSAMGKIELESGYCQTPKCLLF